MGRGNARRRRRRRQAAFHLDRLRRLAIVSCDGARIVRRRRHRRVSERALRQYQNRPRRAPGFGSHLSGGALFAHAQRRRLAAFDFRRADGRPFFGGTYFPPQARGACRDSPISRRASIWRGANNGRRSTPKTKPSSQRLGEWTKPRRARASSMRQRRPRRAPFSRACSTAKTAAWATRRCFRIRPKSAFCWRNRRAPKRIPPTYEPKPRAPCGRWKRAACTIILGGGFFAIASTRAGRFRTSKNAVRQRAFVGLVLRRPRRLRRRAFRRRRARNRGMGIARNARPAGGFCASLDADSEGREGAFYAWDESAAQTAVADAAAWAAFRAHFGLAAGPGFEGRHHFCRRQSARKPPRRWGLPNRRSTICCARRGNRCSPRARAESARRATTKS